MPERHISTNIEQELVKYQKRAAKYKEKNALLNKTLRRVHQRNKEINVSRQFWKGRFKTLQAEKGPEICQKERQTIKIRHEILLSEGIDSHKYSRQVTFVANEFQCFYPLNQRT